MPTKRVLSKIQKIKDVSNASISDKGTVKGI